MTHIHSSWQRRCAKTPQQTKSAGRMLPCSPLVCISPVSRRSPTHRGVAQRAWLGVSGETCLQPCVCGGESFYQGMIVTVLLLPGSAECPGVTAAAASCCILCCQCSCDLLRGTALCEFWYRKGMGQVSTGNAQLCRTKHASALLYFQTKTFCLKIPT